MIDIQEKPLITFMIVAYSQERFIREAVEGALSQTYSPLEIIISDDCSPDRTFEIIQEAVKDYEGPHTIRLNRNEENLGLGGHINYCMTLANGELIVAAAGDDISLPERVDKTHDLYRESGGQAMSIYGAVQVVDKLGRRLALYQRPLKQGSNDFTRRVEDVFVGVSGCSHTWHRKVFDVFGPMVGDSVKEDRVIPFRSSMLGKIYYIDEPLVLYRRHERNLSAIPEISGNGDAFSSRDVLSAMAYRHCQTVTVLENHRKDVCLEHEGIRADVATRTRVAAQIDAQLAELELEIAFLNGKLGDRLNVVRAGFRRGVRTNKIAKWVARILCPGIYIRRARISLSRDYYPYVPRG